MRSRLHTLAMAVLALCAAYLWGAFSHSRNLWPIEILRQVKDSSLVHATDQTIALSQYDSLGRLVFDPYKRQVECPVQSKGTGVLLIMGQSNAANSGQKRFTTRYPDRVVNYLDGRCYVASSPLLGGTNHLGEYITPLADQLVSTGIYDNVVLIVAAVGGSPISRWQHDGDINEALIPLIKSVHTKYRITDAIWHQGASDVSQKTTAKVYVASFRSLISTLTALRVTAPIFMTIETRGCQDVGWAEDNPVAIGQRQLIDNEKIFFGANTDRIVELKDRYDTCHFNEAGQLRTAEAFAESISTVKNRVASKHGAQLPSKYDERL